MTFDSPFLGADAWVLTDGAAGNENQALALARALGSVPKTFRTATRPPWRWFAPRWVPSNAAALGIGLISPWPALAVGCGRQGALALRVVKQLSRGTTRTVQILDPRVDAGQFDLVIAPAHDGLRGSNVITAHGALHAIDADWLRGARRDWPTIGALPGPRTAVLLGGSNRALRLDEAYWRGLATRLGHWLHRDGGSLLLTTSRRSPDWLRDAARAEFSAVPGLQWHGPEDGPNPYAGMLAWADRIVVTPDSINLLSEACATDVPVSCHLPMRVSGKHGAFLQGLVERGRVRAMTDDFVPWPVQALRETDSLAREVATRLSP